MSAKAIPRKLALRPTLFGSRLVLVSGYQAAYALQGGQPIQTALRSGFEGSELDFLLAGDGEAPPREIATGVWRLPEFVSLVGVEMVVGHLLGPVSAAVESGYPIPQISKRVTLRGKWLGEYLRRHYPDVPILLVLDEPYLHQLTGHGTIGSDEVKAALSSVLTDFFEADFLCGLRAGAVPWGRWMWLITEIPFQVLFVDALTYEGTFAHYNLAFQTFLEDLGGWIVWGIVPPVRKVLAVENKFSILLRLKNLWESLGIPLHLLYNSSLLSTAGDLQGTLGDAKEVFRFLVGVSEAALHFDLGGLPKPQE